MLTASENPEGRPGNWWVRPEGFLGARDNLLSKPFRSLKYSAFERKNWSYIMRLAIKHLVETTHFLQVRSFPGS